MCLGVCGVAEESWLVFQVVEGREHPPRWLQESSAVSLRSYFQVLCAVPEALVDHGCWRFLWTERAYAKFSLSSLHLRLGSETSEENILLLHNNAKDIKLLAGKKKTISSTVDKHVYHVYLEFYNFSLSG